MSTSVKTKPLISFVIIAFNEEDNIARAISSILAQEGLKSYEIIGVNDGSSDNTAGVIGNFADANPRIRLVNFSENRGRGAGRYEGVKAANGEYIAFVDADIKLPKHWLKSCLAAIGGYDAVGGTAMPDGDVSYLHGKFHLKPKHASHSTTVTGSNGLFRRTLFDKISFDPTLTEGEDVAFNHALEAAGARSHTVPGLTVEHLESKTYHQSLKWLYVSGLGASRQLRVYHQWRLPDLAFIAFIVTAITGLIAVLITHNLLWLLAPVLFPLATSALHVYTKFEVQRDLWGSVLATFTNYPLIGAYYAGRLNGSFKALPSDPQPKLVSMYFDFEGEWGMPHTAKYEQIKTTHRLLDILEDNNCRATFFICGALIEKYPKLVKEISARGHEIAIHGHTHEHLDTLSAGQLSEFDAQLTRVETKLEQLIGKRPQGFRAPYLMAPKFYVPAVYELLERHGYTWISNHEVRYPEEVFHPRRFGWLQAWLPGGGNLATSWLGKLLLILVNAPLLRRAGRGTKLGLVAQLQWLMAGAAPYRTGNLLEIPLHSPLDCDLIGLPTPAETTSPELMEYFTRSLTDGLNRPGRYYSLNVHDWIMGSANRPEALGQVLANLTATGARFGSIADDATNQIKAQ